MLCKDIPVIRSDFHYPHDGNSMFLCSPSASNSIFFAYPHIHSPFDPPKHYQISQPTSQSSGYPPTHPTPSASFHNSSIKPINISQHKKKFHLWLMTISLITKRIQINFSLLEIGSHPLIKFIRCFYSCGFNRNSSTIHIMFKEFIAYEIENFHSQSQLSQRESNKFSLC